MSAAEHRAGALAAQVVMLVMATAGVVALGPGITRVAATTYLALVAPGLAWVLPVGLRQRDVAAVAVLLTSISVDVLATQLVVHLGGLHTATVTAGIVLATLGGLLLQAVRLPAARRAREGAPSAA